MRRRGGTGCSSGGCCGSVSPPPLCKPCSPCFIPNNNLVLTINGGTPTTLTYPGWSDGTHTLVCSVSAVSLVGGGTWTVSSTSCYPLTYTYTSGGNTAVVTDSFDVACPGCVRNPLCFTCLDAISQTMTIVDNLGTHTATWNGSVWATPILAANSTSPCVVCSGGNVSCGGGSCAPAYNYSVLCQFADTIYVTRLWFEVTAIAACTPVNQYLSATCNPSGGYGGFSAAGSVSGNISVTCGAISWTGTLTDQSVNTPDPVGGSVTVSVPSASPSCCQFFTVRSCGSVLPGVTVNVYSSLGGTLLASGVTDGSGNIFLGWLGSCTVYITVTGAGVRFAAYGQSETFTSNSSFGINLTAASGYTCQSRCGIPLANVLHVTSPLLGSITLTYNASGSLGAGWYFVSSYSYPGCNCCASNTITITAVLFASGSYTEYWSYI